MAQIIGESPLIRELTRLIEVVAPSDATILILGKSGTGKELVARAIHSLSRRKERPFIAVNCGGLSETLLESELFGHRRGAFTGAVGFKRGLIQSADSGTLFLDEVGDMSPALQVKMLRTLQDGEVRPLGTEHSTKVDVRVIAATNRDLRKAVAAGQFREDLFYRLNVISFTTPDLAERREDIPILVRHFLDQTCARLGRKSLRIVPEVMDLLQSYPWPGNVRELRNTIERAIALTPNGEIRPHHLPPEIRATDPARRRRVVAWGNGPDRFGAASNSARSEEDPGQSRCRRQAPRHLGTQPVPKAGSSQAPRRTAPITALLPNILVALGGRVFEGGYCLFSDLLT